MTRPETVLIWSKNAGQPRGEAGATSRRFIELFRARGTFDAERIAVEMVVSFQGLDQQVVYGEPIGPRS